MECECYIEDLLWNDEHFSVIPYYTINLNIDGKSETFSLVYVAHKDWWVVKKDGYSITSGNIEGAIKIVFLFMGVLESSENHQKKIDEIIDTVIHEGEEQVNKNMKKLVWKNVSELKE